MEIRDIERWRPMSWDQIIGNKRLKRRMRSLYLSHGRGVNVMAVGPTGNGKSATINLTLEMLTCKTFSPNAVGPCYECENCKDIDRYGGDYGIFSKVRFDELGNVLPRLNIVRLNASRATPNDVFATLDDCRFYNGRTIIAIDEAHHLRKSELDERALVDMDIGDATWILSTSKPELLDEAFLRRMGGPIATQLPSLDEIRQFVMDRCNEFEISFDELATVSSLIVRSGYLVCEILRFLVHVAMEHQYNFDLETVRDFEFRRYSTGSK